MISTNQWVAAGSTATLLAGGLFLGAPMAAAAPGDAACLQASTQFNAALNAAGVDLRFVSQFELASAAVVAADQNVELAGQAAASSEAAVAAEAQLALAEEALDTALLVTKGADAELAAAIDASTAVDPDTDQAVIDAQQALLAAQTAEDEAGTAYYGALDAYDAALITPEVQAALDALDVAAVEVEDLLEQLNVDAALADEILTLFKAFLAACDADAVGVDPAPVGPAGPGVTPVGPAPVAVPAAPVVVPAAPAAPSTVVTAPTGTNKGLNVQTAVATEDNTAAVALIAALLAVGVAVPAATAARMRRLERAQR